MDPINETHVNRPLAVIDVAGADDATVFAFQTALAARWATAADRTTRPPTHTRAGQPRVNLVERRIAQMFINF